LLRVDVNEFLVCHRRFPRIFHGEVVLVLPSGGNLVVVEPRRGRINGPQMLGKLELRALRHARLRSLMANESALDLRRGNILLLLLLLLLRRMLLLRPSPSLRRLPRPSEERDVQSTSLDERYPHQLVLRAF